MAKSSRSSRVVVGKPRIVLYDAAVKSLLATQEAQRFVAGEAQELASHAKSNMAAIPRVGGEEAANVVTGGSDIRDGIATAYVGTNSSFWHWYEYGTVESPPYRPFRRAAEMLGGGTRFEDPGPGTRI